MKKAVSQNEGLILGQCSKLRGSRIARRDACFRYLQLEGSRPSVNKSDYSSSKMSGRKSASGAIKELMRKIIIAVIAAGLPICAAAAEQPGQQPRKPPASATLRPVRDNPCAAYGPGFVKVEGSSTCVKIGGSVSVEAGGSR
jgi:hypothetical protein